MQKTFYRLVFGKYSGKRERERGGESVGGEGERGGRGRARERKHNFRNKIVLTKT